MSDQSRAIPQRPYYQDDAVTIYHADARALVGLLKADVVLTDPPYGIDGGTGGDARDFRKGVYDARWEDTPTYIETVCVPVVAMLLGMTTRAAITPGVRHQHLYPKPADVGCFWSPAAATHGPWGFTTFQPIFYYGRDFRAGKGALPSGRSMTEPAEKNGHPCPKPIGAWRWLLDKVAEPHDLVLDPFMGSGTTLRAAKDLGRQAIGVEIEERFCEIAAKRMGQEVLPLAI